ncbi:DUF3787 domain-containing protein [Anaerocolumna sp. AGMB13025]|uniref:DUF3787 domain-containing protein n=1 Tax=Anaerocolumna sp. AGMB13025 TaxID=3039116 RepID=UPI00241DBB9D|nr:DUF3787 domain-containing protein [Anaerocolumna sp. AGMB13025]WFR59807.1 DUF3787 domain-containing protein [Anaerocolumna sp. AGMB13025]
MQDNVKNTLSGTNNKRLGKLNCTNNEGTAAWANIEKLQDDTNVGIPNEYNVEKAKNWVDNGSKL